MNDYSYQNWESMSDKALAAHVGEYVRNQRLRQHRTQEELSYAAGVSRSTLSLLERGEAVTLATLLQALRALDRLSVMNAFVVQPLLSPLAIAKMERKARKRARASMRPDTDNENDW